MGHPSKKAAPVAPARPFEHIGLGRAGLARVSGLGHQLGLGDGQKLGQLGANLALYLVPWLLLVLGMLLVIVSTPVTNGVIPLVVLVSVFILLSYCCYLATALLTYSEGYTVTVMIITNLLLNGFIFWIIRMPTVHKTLEAPTASWNSTTLGLLAAGSVLVVAVLVLTAYLQKRKTSFL